MSEVKLVKTLDQQIEDRLLNYEKLSNMTAFKSEMIAIMHRTVAKNTTISELAYFLTVAKSLGLNPINKEVWCYKDNSNNLIVFAGRDGFLKKAQESPIYNGLRSCEVREKDEFSIDIANNEISHKFGVGDRGKIIGAYAIAFVKKGEPTIEWVDIKDYDKGYNTWKAFKADMIKKVAECHALKKAFGITNLVSEHDFVVKDDVAYPAKIEEVTVIPEDKSAERLVLLIERAETKEDLEKLKQHCVSKDELEAYDKQFKKLKK